MKNNIRLLAPVAMLSLSLMLTGCTASGSAKNLQPKPEQNISLKTPLGRANPGYIQWLEHQSMLRQTPSLTAIVSGSTLAWRAPATGNNAASLLRLADVWFALSPRFLAWNGNDSALSILRTLHIPEQLAALGMGGMILDPVAESGADWNADESFAEQGHDIVNFRFSSALGTDEEYAALEQTAQASPITGASTGSGFLLGSGVLPAATGLGPDFFLALRGVRDYPGLYMMVEAPQDVWKDLPPSALPGATADAEGKALSAELTASLRVLGVLPPAFSRDTALPGLTDSGWAATAEMIGVDGVNRRWIYRWAGSPRRPVLNWDDPSGAAQRLLAASAIRQVGQLRQPLVSLSVEALWGQETGQNTGDISPEPALSALRSLSRDVRRYGAWSMLKDEIPAALLPLVQSSGVDFAFDSVTSPALEYAMLTGDAAPLRHALEAALRDNVQQNRLWRSTASGNMLAFQNISKADPRLQLMEPWQHLLAGKALTLNAFTLSAAAVGANPDTLRAEAAGEASGDLTSQKSSLQQVRDAHLLQIAFRLFQPGLFVLRSDDVAGLLAVPDVPGSISTSPPRAWTVDGSGQSVTKQGIPASAGLYAPLDGQATHAGPLGSFSHSWMGLNTLRRNSRVAEGSVVAVPDMGENAAAAVLTRLPEGDFLLCAGNFSRTKLTTDVTMPSALLPANASALDLVTGNTVALSKGHMRLQMQPWQYRIVRISGI